MVPVVAALLMDVGMLRVPAEVLAKTTPLTPDDRRLIDAHPIAGAEAIRNMFPDAPLIAADPGASATYSTYLALISKLTNPLVERGPRSEFRVFPPSASHEGDLIKRLYGASPIPDGFSLIGEVIESARRVKSS